MTDDKPCILIVYMWAKKATFSMERNSKEKAKRKNKSEKLPNRT